MGKEKNVIYKICCLSASAVAIFTLMFLVSLITFDFSEWMGIDNYQSTFRPIQMFAVIPSLLLAISYVIFVSGLHIYASDKRKNMESVDFEFRIALCRNIHFKLSDTTDYCNPKYSK